jgi:hypothetical protein
LTSASVTSCININSWTDFTNAIDTAVPSADGSVTVNLCAGFDISHDGGANDGYTIGTDNIRLTCDKKTGTAGDIVSQSLDGSVRRRRLNYEANPLSGETGPRCVISGTARHLNVAASGTTILGFDFYDSEYGAVQVLSSARMTNVLHSIFVNNVRSEGAGLGAGLAIDSGAKLTSVLHCEFSNNEADDAGAIYTAADADVSVYHSYFHNNSAVTGSGGAITASAASQVILSRNEFYQNTVQFGDGPALYDGEAGEASCDAGENVACLNEDIDDGSMCDGIWYEINGNIACDAFGLACKAPSVIPTPSPTKKPTKQPTRSPTLAPSVSHMPSCQPSFSPTAAPTAPTPSPTTAAPVVGVVVVQNPTLAPKVVSTKAPHDSHKSTKHTHSSVDAAGTDDAISPSKHNHTHASHESHKHSHKSHTHSIHAQSEHQSKTHSHTSKVHTHVQTVGSEHTSKTHTHTSKLDAAAATLGTENSKHTHDYHTHGSAKTADTAGTATTPADVSNDVGDIDPTGVNNRMLADQHTHEAHGNSKHEHDHTHKSKYDNGVDVNPESVEKCAPGPQFPPTRALRQHSRRAFATNTVELHSNLRRRSLAHW